MKPEILKSFFDESFFIFVCVISQIGIFTIKSMLLGYLQAISFIFCYQSGYHAHESPMRGLASRRLLSSSRQNGLIPPSTTSIQSASLSSPIISPSAVFMASLALLISQPVLAADLVPSSDSDFVFVPPTAESIASFVPPEVGSEIYVGSIVSLIPIVWASFEFNSRIQTQRRCLLCKGSGLVKVTRSGSPLTRPRKCWSCGGFLPWLGWKYFFFSTFFDVGNGGVLQRPAPDYEKIQADVRSGVINGDPLTEDSMMSDVEENDALIPSNFESKE